MQKLFMLFCVLMLAGCAAIPSTITFHPNGQIASATNYILPVNGGIATPNIADNWWSGAIKIVTDSLGNYLALVKQISPIPASTPTPTPVPTPAPVTPVPVPVTPVPVTPVPVTPVPTPTPYPAPVPPVPPIASSVFSREGNTLTLDLNTLPGSMRAAGFNGSDNALFYVIAHIYAYGPGKHFVPHAELDPLNNDATRTAMFNWFDGEVLKVAAFMRSNLTAEVMAISNDGRDRCGFRLGPAIMERLKEFGNRVTLGKILPPEEY